MKKLIYTIKNLSMMIGLVGIILAFIFNIYFPIKTNHGENISVPNLIGFTYQEASNILQEIGLLPSASGDTGGRVSEQNPREGEFIDPEGFVELSFGS